eukprot:Skav209575  [mRNA]  locus=scaffold281:214280:215743:+ [translate_table: standard]
MASESACWKEYINNKPRWMAISGATTVYVPMDHRPDWYWEEIMKRRGITSKPPSGYADFWLDQLISEAQNQLQGCAVHGGRYWEVTVLTPKLFQALRGGSRPGFLRRLSILTGSTDELYLRRPEDLPGLMRMSACFPSVCNEEDLMNQVFEDRFAVDFMGPNAARKLVNASFQDVVQVHELQDWPSFNIDFAIGGAGNCGTMSLLRNLNQHPEIAFSHLNEDDYFTADLALRLLPFRWQVENYNARLDRIKDEKEKSSGIRPRLVGISNPNLYFFGLARRKLAAMPDLKMIFILCEPVGRLEKTFMRYHYCFDDLDEAQKRGLAGTRAPDQACFKSAKSLISERRGQLRDFWLQATGFAEHMPAMMDLFSGRIILVNQESLRDNPEQTFNSLSQFLGAKSSFPGHVTFPRYNSIGGHRTDLCYNRSWIRALQRHLEPEYRMLEDILSKSTGNVPPSLHLRLTRCDIPEVAGSYCPLTVCHGETNEDL